MPCYGTCIGRNVWEVRLSGCFLIQTQDKHVSTFPPWLSQKC